MKGVIYARYSGDRQRETSIDDQVRNCNLHAAREGVAIAHVYADKAVTGAVTARAEYQRMLDAADAREFDVLLVDDLSRLSRDDYEMKGVLRRFQWHNLRVVGVTDGYDSARKGHKIHAGFKGLMNEIFLDDLRERTHRGMTGQALKGYNCGGRTYGYRNVPIEDETRKDAYGRPAIIAVRYEVDPDQAAVVRTIHERYAQGHSYKWIASELNRRRIRSSRGGTWAVTAIKVILENEMYEGRLCWNRRMWVKHPETGKRTYRERPREEWVVSDMPLLRIVPADIIAAVRMRQRRNKEQYGDGLSTSSAQRYLFSGLMSCAECGGNMVIVANGRYGCAAHKTRGSEVCRNSVSVSRRIVEQRLLASIKTQLLEAESVERFKQATSNVIEAHNASEREGQLQHEYQSAMRERDNILSAIKQGIITPGTKQALQQAEARVSELREEISHIEQWNVSAILPRAVERYQLAVTELEHRLDGHVEPARDILRSLLGDRIRLHRKGEYLEAEIPNHVPALLAKTLNENVDSFGCGGAQRFESTFVSLAPISEDYVPLAHRGKIKRRNPQANQSHKRHVRARGTGA